MSGPPAQGAAGLSARRLGGLLPGLLLFDLLLNLPALAPSAPVRSLLAPTLDLLVLVAACMGIAQAGEGARRPLRAVLAVVAVGLVAASAGLRFAWSPGSAMAMTAAAGWALTGLMAVVVAVAAFLISGLVVRGVESRVTRSVLLLAVALAAVLQVVSGRRLFAPSVIPKLVALVG